MFVRSRQLVAEFLENVSRRALEDYQQLIREYVKRKTGVYALYRGDRLKYVGLATDLRNRLKMHLTDRHAQSWDKFSVFLTVDDKHLRELEALVIRIATPKENLTMTKFKKAENLRSRFRRDIRSFQRIELDEILGTFAQQPVRRPKATSNQFRKPKEPALKPFLNLERGYLKIYSAYKGKKFTALVTKKGLIKAGKKAFYTPSRAAFEIANIKGAVDGWVFWKYKDPKTGELVPLDNLRKK